MEPRITAFALLVVLAIAAAPAYARIERDKKVIARFKRAEPCPATSQPKGSCPGYIIDHVIALKCGGADHPSNMQWQTIADAKAKDKWETKGCWRKPEQSVDTQN